MTPNAIEDACRSMKQGAMPFPVGGGSERRFGRSEIDRIIPHRPPFAFVDRIVAVDLDAAMIEVESDLDPGEPVFSGHFPGRPVYPGVLQIETMGQAGLCLAFFTRNRTLDIDDGARPVEGLFTRVHQAVFQQPVAPGARLTVRARMLDDNDMTGIVAAQVLVDRAVCSFAVLEVYYP